MVHAVHVVDQTDVIQIIGTHANRAIKVQERITILLQIMDEINDILNIHFKIQQIMIIK